MIEDVPLSEVCSIVRHPVNVALLLGFLLTVGVGDIHGLLQQGHMGLSSARIIVLKSKNFEAQVNLCCWYFRGHEILLSAK